MVAPPLHRMFPAPQPVKVLRLSATIASSAASRPYLPQPLTVLDRTLMNRESLILMASSFAPDTLFPDKVLLSEKSRMEIPLRWLDEMTLDWTVKLLDFLAIMPSLLEPVITLPFRVFLVEPFKMEIPLASFP